MKAKYIIDALDAMKAAEKALAEYPNVENAQRNYRLSDTLQGARIALYIYSGLHDTKVKVEEEA